MPLAAQDILNQRRERDKAELERAFKQEWNSINRQLSSGSGNPQIEAARQRALSNLHDTYYDKAATLKSKYDKISQSHAEIDQWAKSGRIASDKVEELKQRALMSPDVEKEAFPTVETFEQVDAEQSRIQKKLDRFDVGRMEGQGDNARFYSDPETRTDWEHWLQPWRVKRNLPATAGGVYAKESVYDEKKGKDVIHHRPATQQEMYDYATYQEALKRMGKEASRLQTAANRSTRMLNREAGTFADKAVNQVRQQVDEPTPETGRTPMYAKNKKTGQRIVSNDGGQTWQPAE